MSDIVALHIEIGGRVQGVGFRPFVARLAYEYGLCGWVRNRSGQVEIRAEGQADALTAFRAGLVERAPPLARPECPQVFSVEPEGCLEFVIADSEAGETSVIHIPPDYFVCDDCLAEMQNPAERRYRYPFINCTQCGPRYTLIDALPYDRPNTAMAEFELCPECRSEYANPLDRRYHAQPLACAHCGPSLIFRRPGRPDVAGNEDALSACLAGLREGLIVAIKGVGGYHLLCDATAAEPVNKLRQRKPRPDKPLAVLVPWRGEDGLGMVKRLAEPDDGEKRLLVSPLRPIVLVAKKADSVLAESIAPDLGEVGLMLPHSPLHHLLAEGYGAPLVSTSANLSGEPVLTDESEVESRLGRVADAFLHHDRPIRRPADDSVLRRIADKPRTIRIGRGLAPFEIKLPFILEKPLLAVGADLKNTVALGFGERLVVSQHIGDLGTVRSAQVFERVIADLQRLYAVKPEAIVCDAHPGYHSSRWAERQGVACVPVYHHHAHASALVGEHGLEGEVLVFTWDGTGFGEDGTIWGGEALRGSPGAWRRVASLRPFRLPGGDKASREPWRSALSLCWEQGLVWRERPEDAELLHQAWLRRINCPLSSSVGRLFDAAAALVGVARHSTYEGHAAMRLEALSDGDAEPIPLTIAENENGILIADWGPLLPVLMDESLSQTERGSIFHASLAGVIAGQAKAIRERYGIECVGLSGGVFQNRVLAEGAMASLKRLGFKVYLHETVPAGDGGISFGQIIEAGSR